MTLNRTGIETADYTWNLYTGCLRGCPFCYARKLAKGRLKTRYLSNECVSPSVSDGDFGDPFFPRFWADRRGDPFTVPARFRSKNPHLDPGTAMIFAIDMGDIFGPWIPVTWIQDLMDTMGRCSQVFQILTKFPGNLSDWAQEYGLPRNVWAGVTVCSQSMVGPAVECLSHLEGVKYLCVEPLQERITVDLDGVDWLIIGAQTDPLVLPEKLWVEELLEEASRCNTRVYLKKSLRWDRIIHEWPGGFHV